MLSIEHLNCRLLQKRKTMIDLKKKIAKIYPEKKFLRFFHAFLKRLKMLL